ncbi:transmembrane protein 183 isoform X2 [Zootermopsis nevadensis]|uniref:transmembrane protein 183 isoform X2 n=1 Tax=Zootermopsis nevadensis TaxID=136037 RepID=UPI000B8E56B6|nr:transmembrane protein 183 isoform X2 [Zootermopsis nevadensis]
MSGSSKNAGRRMSSQKNLNKSLGDVTLNDYANSPISNGKGRLRKAASNSVVREVKQLTTETDNRAWYEKLEDYEGDFEFVEDDEDGEKVIVKRHSRRRRKTASEGGDDDGVEYPLDIWYLISEYIRPEDVSTFARICKSALHVVSTAKFWFRLYRRHYKTTPNLPERLQPECMVRLYGLRACVIRALHYTYPPFVNKLKAVTTFEGEPHDLIKRQCTLMWHQKCLFHWQFFFKFKQSSLVLGRGTGRRAQKPDLLEMLEDVSANQDEGCKVLQVTCLNYVAIPMVMGLSLCSVSLTMSQGMRHYRLQMSFGSGHMCYTVGKPNISSLDCSTVVLDPVVNIRVLDWWHPMYPHASVTTFSPKDGD